MSSKAKVLKIVGLSTLILLAGFLPIFFTVILPHLKDKTNPPLQLEFTQTEMISCPNHIAWFVAGISTTDTENRPILVNLEANTTIPMEYVFWNNSAQSHVLELFCFPTISLMDQCVEINVSISQGDISISQIVLLQVINWTIIMNLPEILPFQSAFVDYMHQNHPDWGIDNTITWTPISNNIQILIVEHILFQSTSYELELARHAMIPPSDWIEVYIRPRNQTAPVWSGKIPSCAAWNAGNHTIVETTPPAQVYRGSTTF